MSGEKHDLSGTNKRTGQKTILDCGVQGCCPTVYNLADGSIEIVGDDGQSVTLSKAQFEHLKKI